MSIILKENFTLNNKAHKSHITTKFDLRDKCNRLRIDFKYSPAVVSRKEDIDKAFLDTECEPVKESFLEESALKNLITVSLYRDEVYVGCAHRHAETQSIIISPKQSTSGFSINALSPSYWEVIMSIHGAYSENIKVELEIYAE